MTSRATSLAFGALVALVGTFGPMAPAASAEARKLPLPGFQDARWGDGVASVTAKLKKRFRLAGRHKDGTPLFVGPFGGFKECSVLPYFKTGKLYQVRVVVASQDGLDTVAIYQKLTKNLGQVYGPVLFVAATDYETDDAEMYDKDNPMSEEVGLKLADDVMAMRKWLKTEWEFPQDGYISMFTVKNDGSRPDVPLYVAIDYYSEKVLKALEQGTLKDY